MISVEGHKISEEFILESQHSHKIQLDFSFKTKAKFDIDFEDIKKLNEFKEIIHARL